MRRRVALLALAALALPAGCGEGATDDNVVASVPAGAEGYLHLARDADDWEDAREALGRLPAFEAVVLELLAGAVQVPGDGEAGLALLPGADEPVLLAPDDPAESRSLADAPDYRRLLGGLPDQRFVHAYVARGAAGFLRSLDETVASAAVAADVDDDRMRIRAQIRHRGEPGPCGLGSGEPEIVDVADPEAALYVEVPSVACAIGALRERSEGVDDALAGFGRMAERRGGVSLDGELMPFLERRGALIASPGAGTPTLTLVVDGVDEREAIDLLARVQPALIQLLAPRQLGQAPTFGSVDVAGVTAATVRIAPGIELSYAAWDDRLVLSTGVGGIAAMRRGDGLPGTDGFDAVLADARDDAAALVFLDLNQLLTLAEAAGLAQDPRYVAVRDDLQKLRAAGAVLSREEDFTTGELIFQIP